MPYLRKTMTSIKNTILKMNIIGDSAVGKTALLRTYLTSGFEFSEKYSMTMGVVPSITEISIPNHDHTIKFLFLDTTGSDVYYGILSKYWENLDISLIVFDVSSATSFANLNQWLEFMKTFGKSSSSEDGLFTAAIFANKTDLVDRRVISTEMGEKVAEQNKMKYFEGSAKNNEGVSEMFQWFSQQWSSEIQTQTDYSN